MSYRGPAPTTEEDLRFTQAVRLASEIGRREAWERLFRWIDRRGFFADQVAHFAARDRARREAAGGGGSGVFAQLASDLERTLLPATVELRDWERFLHYFLVAANLRGAAEALAVPEILEALARSGREVFARELASRLPEREARASALAAIAGAFVGHRSSDAFAAVVRDLADDLDGAAPPASPAEAETRCRALVEVGRRLGPAYRRKWPAWIAPLEPWPELAGRVRLAVAEGFLGPDADVDGAGLWEALETVTEGEAALALLERGAGSRSREPRSLIVQAKARLGAAAGWRLVLAAMAASGDAAAGEARSLWDWAIAELGAPAWTGELVDRGGAAWRHLSPPQLAAALAAVRDPEAEVALLVARWDAAATDETAARLRAAVEWIPGPEPRLHRLLAFLWADRSGPRRQAHRRRLAELCRWLERNPDQAAARSLVQVLDLVAELEPRALRRELEGLLWSPAGTAELLRRLAGEARSGSLQAELRGRAERYAAQVVHTEAEGFALRRDLIVRLTCRRALADGDLRSLRDLPERLLPEEEDELRATLATALAEVGREELAAEAANGIADRRRRFVALLRAHRRRPVPEELLEPLALYEVAADTQPVTDALAALAALRQVPADPDAVASTCLRTIERPGRRVEALVDLAWQALAYQRRFPPRRQDPVAAVLPLREALGVAPSDAWLLALAPELVELGSQLGRKECFAELQEAVERIVELDAAPWPLRRRALESVVAALPRLVAAPWPGVEAGDPARRRLAARFLRWLAELPDSLPGGPGREALRRDWPGVVAWMVAVRDRLPSMDLDLGVLARRRDWLAPGGEALRFCRLPASERAFAARAALAEGLDEEGAELVILLSASDPEAAVELLARSPPGADRDDLSLRLVGSGWLVGDSAFRATESIGEEATRLVARAWAAAWRPDADGLAEALAAAVAAGALPSEDPARGRLRARLWSCPVEATLPVLARAAVASLAAGGREAAHAAADWFLAATLPPVWPSASGGGDGPLARFAAAARRSTSLRTLPP